ncbi:MAG: arabinan endo-1,5-alpha-L-arabinosidase [Myxococcales bacterium]|jgi:beta-xylosidase
MNHPVSSRRTSAYALLSAFSIGLSGHSAHAATSGSNGSHDPSRLIESNGKFYVFSTGGGGAVSSNGLAFTSGSRLQLGPWVSSWAPNGTQGFWAPDGIFFGGQYLLYYSVCASSGSGNIPCAVGLVTTPTLDASSPSFKLTDRGKVVANDNSVKFGAIDPAPVVDADGNLWVIWGGGYANPTTADSIWVTRLDNATGLPLTSDPGWKPVSSPGYPVLQGHKEGPYLHYNDGYYYVFWQTGGCCSGASSTYQINLARSSSIKGPYTGDRVFYKSNGSIHGPGHIGIYQCGNVRRFTYHYYPDSGGSVLGENDFTWGSDGWPVAGNPATTPLTPCATNGQGGGGAGGGSNGGGSGLAGAGGAVSNGGSGGDDSSFGGAGSPSASAGSSGAVAAGGDAQAVGAASAPGAAGSTSNVAGAAQAGGAAMPGEPTDGDGGCNVTRTAAKGTFGWAGLLAGLGLVAGIRRRQARRVRATRWHRRVA